MAVNTALKFARFRGFLLSVVVYALPRFVVPFRLLFALFGYAFGFVFFFGFRQSVAVCRQSVAVVPGFIRCPFSLCICLFKRFLFALYSFIGSCAFSGSFRLFVARCGLFGFVRSSVYPWKVSGGFLSALFRSSCFHRIRFIICPFWLFSALIGKI